MGKKGYAGDSVDEVSGMGEAPSMKPYSKHTVEGNEMNVPMEHKGYEPTHIIHKGHGGIAGAGVDGHHKK